MNQADNTNVLINRNLSSAVFARLNSRALASFASASRRHRAAVLAYRPLPGGGILNPAANNSRRTRFPTAQEVTEYGVDPAQLVLDRTPGVLKPYGSQPRIDYTAPREQWVRVLTACMRRVDSMPRDRSLALGNAIAVNLRELYWGLKVRKQAAAANHVKMFADEYSHPRRRPDVTRLRQHVPAMSKIAVFLTCSQFVRNLGGLTYVAPPRTGR